MDSHKHSDIEINAERQKRGDVPPVADRIVLDAGQEYADGHLMTVGSVKRVAPIVGPAICRIVPR